RQVAIRAGLPASVPGATVNRFCASGPQAIAQTAQRIMAGEGEAFVAGGVECISTVQNTINQHMLEDTWMQRHYPAIYMPMLHTAENVASRYDDEIVPITVRQAVADPKTRAMGTREVTLAADEGVRPDTSYEGVAKIRTAVPGGVITAGNASQFSDGASASVLMSAAAAARRGIAPLGVFRGYAVAGCEADEMGIGPVFAVPKLLQRAGLTVDDIGLWELNEAFAVQVLYCMDKLGIPHERLNVN